MFSRVHRDSTRLNQECFCMTLDRDALRRGLETQIADPQLAASILEARPSLFSNTPVFLSEGAIREMLGIVHAIEAVAALPAYRERVLSWAPAIAHHEFGPLGVFMGYDFHLTATGPKLIEINTNAGGAFLNALLLRVQRLCCAEVDSALTRFEMADFETAVLDMFDNEWRLQRGTGKPRRIAIVDDAPEQQYLYPEFLLALRLFESRGIAACIADAAELRYVDGELRFQGQPVDLVYNRLVDFALDGPEHAALRAAYLDGAVVVTPAPRAHALFADKRNMVLLSDPETLHSWHLSPDVIAALQGVPRTVRVDAERAAELWAARKNLFFKPAGGHGSKAVYRGDKLTTRVWAEILQGGYVAQEFAAPSPRNIRIDGVERTVKTDVRLYVYDGRPLITAARLYSGQTTNFRTPGGGFAPLLAV
jgi:hypothetical protein